MLLRVFNGFGSFRSPSPWYGMGCRLPKDLQLQFRKVYSDAAMDTKPEREMLPWILPIGFAVHQL